MKMQIHPFLPSALLLTVALLPISHAQDATVAVLQQTDANHDGALSQAEVTAGLRRQLGLPAGTNSMALAEQQALFRRVFGPGPSYPVQTLAAHPYFNPKIFGLEKAVAPKEPVDTVSLWVPEDKHPLKVRRTLDDLMEPDPKKAKGALISYTNDFNAKSDQWSFHGIVGFNLIEKKNVHLGESANGVRPPLNHELLQGVTERWLIPSVQWDKVTTSRTNTDEIDALIPRLTAGFKYVARDPDASLIDGFRFNISGSYATDSSNHRGVLAGELDIKPFKKTSFLGIGLNEDFQRVGIFGLRPEFSLHAEGGTVTDAGGDATLLKEKDFLRLGGNFGLSVRFEQNTGRFHAMRGLLLHTGFQYYVDVTNSGPDVDLFTTSADWLLDPPKDENDTHPGHYTLTVEYRNGRAPLVLQRDNRITIGLGIRF